MERINAMDILDNLPLLKFLPKVFKPKSRRTIKICLGLAVIAFPGSFGAWMIGHAIAHRQALLMSASNAAGVYITGGLVRSMGTLRITAPVPPAPAAMVPVVDDPSRPLILSVPSNAHGGR